MGKDREGKFHPEKGKPTGAGKQDSVELHLKEPEALEQYLDIADKYTSGDEEIPANIRVRHPNRLASKSDSTQQDKQRSTPIDKALRKKSFATNGTTHTDVTEGERQLTRETFRELADYTADCCVSAYLAPHLTSVEGNEQVDPSAFRTLLQNVTSSLREKNIDAVTIQNMLAPAQALLNNESFWKNGARGLACFFAKDFFAYFQLPTSPLEEVLVNKSFFLQPLVPVLASQEYFYVLVISKKQAKLYRADEFGMEYIPSDEVPNGVDDVVHFEEKDDQNLWRTGSSGGGGGAVYHGAGGGRPDEKDFLSLYMKEVDETLWSEVLHTENVPLVLAGVEYLLPIYKAVTQYKHVWDAPLTGSYENASIASLHKEARALLTPYFEQRTKKALESFGIHSATEKTSSDPTEVIPAAHYGRVSRLFVVKGEHLWGTFDEMNNTLKLYESKGEHDECMLDKAVIKTIQTGGEVHFLDREDMPDKSSIAALMRY